MNPLHIFLLFQMLCILFLLQFFECLFMIVTPPTCTPFVESLFTIMHHNLFSVIMFSSHTMLFLLHSLFFILSFFTDYKWFQHLLMNQLTELCLLSTFCLSSSLIYFFLYYVTHLFLLQRSPGLHNPLCHLIQCFSIHFTHPFLLLLSLKFHPYYSKPYSYRCTLTEIFYTLLPYRISCSFLIGFTPAPK